MIYFSLCLFLAIQEGPELSEKLNPCEKFPIYGMLLTQSSSFRNERTSGSVHNTKYRNYELSVQVCISGPIFCPFYGRNSAIFPMENHIFFPNFCPKIPNSKDKKTCCQTKVFRGIKARENALLMGM